MNWQRVCVVVFVWALAGCGAMVTKVDRGEALVANRLAVQADVPWNRFERGLIDPTPTWTHDGVGVDTLKFYVGVADGQPLVRLPPMAGQPNVEPPPFRATMPPEDWVGLFRTLLTRDGSAFTLDRVEPVEFVGSRGIRFEYTLNRKVDDVRLKGVGWAAVRGNELHAIVYTAPRLAFFPRHLGSVEALARSARLKS